MYTISDILMDIDRGCLVITIWQICRIKGKAGNIMITSKFFNMGQIVTTKSINDLMAAEQKFAVEITIALQRYAVKDWGNLEDEDKETNDVALEYGERLLGAYETCKGKIWIITEADRTVTTILFPEEY